MRTRDEEEVCGYAELMNVIFENWQNIPLSENHIKQLHGILLKPCSRDQAHRGKYKTVENNVEAFDENGDSLGIILKTTSPFETPFKITALLDSINTELASDEAHPLIIIGIFLLEFLAIHPFKDENGRLSRALKTLLLLKCGYSFASYSSLESVVEKNKEIYYLALRRSQNTLNDASPDWDSWLIFFFQSLQKQKTNLQMKMAREKMLQGDLPALSISILNLVREQGTLKSSDIQRLTGESKSTIRLRLNELVASRDLARHGRGPATWYTLLSAKK